MKRLSRAVVTMVRDESVFLPIWLGYYARFFAPQDIYVLDDGTSDGSTGGPGFVRVPVQSELHDVEWLTRTLQEFQHELLGRYDVVLTVDVDEIVAPDPALCDLGAYIHGLRDDYVTCAGFEVLHVREVEPPFDPTSGVLAQRSHWFESPAYDKAALARVPIEWSLGRHFRADGHVNQDAGLLLIHLDRMDYDICLERHRQRVSRAWLDSDIEQGLGYQNRIVAAEQFEGWFYGDASDGRVPVVERIPARFRDLV